MNRVIIPAREIWSRLFAAVAFPRALIAQRLLSSWCIRTKAIGGRELRKNRGGGAFAQRGCDPMRVYAALYRNRF